MKWVFEELALGRFNTEQVWKQAVRKTPGVLTLNQMR